MGYRLKIDSVNYPTPLAAGACFAVTTVWSNVNEGELLITLVFKFKYSCDSNTGAIYNTWNVNIQLRPTSSSTSTTVSWSRTSLANLKNSLPISSTGSYQVLDRLSIPTTLAAGTYPFFIIMCHHDYYLTMADMICTSVLSMLITFTIPLLLQSPTQEYVTHLCEYNDTYILSRQATEPTSWPQELLLQQVLTLLLALVVWLPISMSLLWLLFLGSTCISFTLIFAWQIAMTL